MTIIIFNFPRKAYTCAKMKTMAFRIFLLCFLAGLPFWGFSQLEELVPTWDHDTLVAKPGLFLFPTPARDYVIIEFTEEADRVKEISIKDLNGKEVNCWVPSPRIESAHKIEMWTGDLPEGAYNYTIYTLTQQFSGRFVVSRSVMVQ